MTRLDTRLRYLYLIHTATILVLVLFCVHLLLRTTVLMNAMEDIKAYSKARRALNEFLITVLKAESGQRGYLLTDSRDYLQRYDRACANLSSTIDVLRADPILGRLTDTDILTSLGHQKTEELRRTIQLWDAGRREESLGLVKTDYGESLMVSISDTRNELVTRWDIELDKASGRLYRLHRMTQIITGGGCLILIVVYLIMVQQSIQAWRRRVESEAVAAVAATELARARSDLDAKAHFLNAISHDLRTPINGLGLMAEVAEALVEGRDTALLETIGEIKSGARNLVRLLESLVEAGRADAREPVLADFSAQTLFAELKTTFQPEATKRGLDLQFKAEPIKLIRSDYSMVLRIVSNLMSNALKFTKSGTVAVKASHVDAAIYVSVSDTGIGIKPSEQARLFTDFFQIGNRHRNAQDGFGLGLSIARRLAHKLGGDVTLKSTEGTGSTFTLVLPQGDQR